MARDVIARLRVEHQQWDEGMKRAQKGVDDLQRSTGGMDAIMGKAMKRMGAMAAAWASVDVAAKAFNKTIAGSQTLTDEWGRTMQASTRVVDGFFESLAQGNFQSFLGGLDSMIAKAREAYDAIDTLGTYDIFAGPLKAKYEAEIRKLKYEIRAGVGNADEKKAEIRAIEDKMLALAGRESFLSGDAARKLLASYTNTQGGVEMLEELFMSGDQAQNMALEMYAELEKKHKTVRRPVANWYGMALTDKQAKKRGYDGVDLWGKPYRLDWDDDKDARAVAESLKAFGEKGDERLKEVAALYARQYRSQAEVYAKKMENLETLNFKGAGGGGGAKEYTAQKFDVTGIEAPTLGVTTSMAELEAQLAQWQLALKEATTSAGMQAAEAMTLELQAKIEAQPIALRLDLPEEEVAGITQTMEDLGERIRSDIKPLKIKIDPKPLENTDKEVMSVGDHLDGVSKSFGAMGQAMQMLEDPSAKVAGIVMSAVANVAQSFSMALAGARDPWSWIAAAASGTATMVATISAIKSATAGSFADGGVVRGGAFTGDAVPIMANAGEVVLNAAQQQNLAGQLQPRDMGGERQPYTNGETIWLGVSNYLKRSGKGEIVTTR